MRQMRSTGLGIAAAGALVIAMLGIGLARGGHVGAGERFTGTVYDPPQPAPGFQLVDHDGRRVRMEDYRGTALLVFFGYTHCPDVCPLTLQKLSRVLGSMGDAADTSDVRVLLVTVDPVRDTPEALAEYVRRFGPFTTGLTGEAETLAEMRTAYGVFAEPPPPGGDHRGMEMSHTSRVFGIDRAGEIRLLLPMEAGDDVIARDVEILMRS